MKNEEKNEKIKSLFIKKNKLIDEKLHLQKELEKKMLHQRLVQSAIKKEEVEENLRRRERLLERNRIRLLNEIEEKDKRINLIKSQKLKIWEEQKKLSKNFEENSRKLLKRFNMIMAKRNKKSKNEIIKEIFDDNLDNKILNRNPSNLNISSNNKSVNFPNNNTNKKDIFLTNLPVDGLNSNKNI